MTALTKKQRAEVVELLRCAADVANTATDPTTAPVNVAEAGYAKVVRVAAWKARSPVLMLASGNSMVVENDAYVGVLLEAAQRVEDEEWP